MRVGCARPPPFITFTLTSKVAVYAPAEWADTLTLFHLYQYMYFVVKTKVKTAAPHLISTTRGMIQLLTTHDFKTAINPNHGNDTGGGGGSDLSSFLWIHLYPIQRAYILLCGDRAKSLMQKHLQSGLPLDCLIKRTTITRLHVERREVLETSFLQRLSL